MIKNKGNKKMKNVDYLIIESSVAYALDQEENYTKDGYLIHDYVASDVYIELISMDYDDDDLNDVLVSMNIYQSSIGKA